MQYTKLFHSILDSSIWQESKETKLLWVTMLAMVNKDGDVIASIPGLAARSGLAIGECEQSLQKLLSPDPYSRTKDFDGRRIRAIDGGWELLNHAKYRRLMSAEERKEYNRLKQAERRARLRETVKHCQTLSNGVNDNHGMSMTVNDMSALSTHTDTEADANSDTKADANSESDTEANRMRALPPDLQPPRIQLVSPTLAEVQAWGEMHGVTKAECRSFWQHFQSVGWVTAANIPIRDWKARLSKWREDNKSRKFNGSKK
jgi:hypothetical protein